MTSSELADQATGLRLDAAPTARVAERFDFRRPHTFAREAVRNLQVEHEVFSRRIASAWGNTLRALLQVEPLGVDQVSYDDYIRSMPSPNLLAVIGIPPLPGAVVVEVNVALALVLVDRLLGGRVGSGRAVVPATRRPTDLETFLLRDLLHHAVAALEETLGPLTGTRPELWSLEYKPQLVQVAAPSDMTLLLSFRVGVSQGVETEGLLTVCYPSASLVPILERVAGAGRTDDGADAAGHLPRPALVDSLDDVDVELDVCLRESRVAAADLARLQVGDVIRLEHRVGQPALGRVGGAQVLVGHLGRRGRRAALQIAGWHRTGRPEHPPAQPVQEDPAP